MVIRKFKYAYNDITKQADTHTNLRSKYSNWSFTTHPFRHVPVSYSILFSLFSQTNLFFHLHLVSLGLFLHKIFTSHPAILTWNLSKRSQNIIYVYYLFFVCFFFYHASWCPCRNNFLFKLDHLLLCNHIVKFSNTHLLYSKEFQTHRFVSIISNYCICLRMKIPFCFMCVCHNERV